MLMVQKSDHLQSDHPVFEQEGNCEQLLILLRAFTEGVLRSALQMRKLSQRD